MYTDHDNEEDYGSHESVGFQAGDRQEQRAESCDAGGVQRDARGRFVGSGNKRGRPKSRKLPEPTSLAAALVRELEEPVMIKVGGVTKHVPAFAALAKRMIASGLGGSLMDMMRLLRLLVQSGALNVSQDVIDHREQLAAQTSVPGWTDELEEKYRVVMGEYDGESENQSDGRPPTPPVEPEDDPQA